MQRNKKLAIVVVFAMLFNLLLPIIGWNSAPVYAVSPGSILADQLSLSVSSDGNGVLGRDETLTVNISNNSANEWVYNLSLEAVLDSGLTVASSDNAYTGNELVLGTDQECTQLVSWKDIKDLAPGETFSFGITVNLSERYREMETGSLIEPVGFGDVLKSEIRMYGGAAPQELATPDLEKNESFDIRVYPFEMTATLGGKLLKGAGTTASKADNLWNMGNKIHIVNNTVFPSAIDLSGWIANGLEVGSFTGQTPSVQTLFDTGLNLGKTYLEWQTIEVAADEVRDLTYNTAVFNNYYTESGVNTGNPIVDDTSLLSTFSYDGKVIIDSSVPVSEIGGFTGVLNGHTIAKDIRIFKSVTPTSNIGYGDDLTYRLLVQTNQYYDVPEVKINDEFGADPILGAAQAFLPSEYAMAGYELLNHTTGAAFVYVMDVDFNGSGHTRMDWDLGTVEKAKTNLTIAFKTEVLEKWKKADVYFVANDRITNNVSLQAKDIHDQVIIINDAASASVGTHLPVIVKEALEVNGIPISGNGKTMPTEVNIGDVVKFQVTYNGDSISVQQKEVEIEDYLPIGMTVLPGTVQYIDGVDIWNLADDSESTSNYLNWKWSPGNIAEKPGYLIVQYEAVVNDIPSIVTGKQSYNLAKLSLKNTEGIVDSFRDQVEMDYTEPDLMIAKTSNGSAILTDVVGGDLIPFTIEIENAGTGAAYDVSIKDSLPIELENPLYVSATSTIENVTNNKVLSILSGSLKSVEFGTIDQILPGEVIKINYDATAINPLGNLKSFKNNATVDAYYSVSGKTGRIYGNGPSDNVSMTGVSPAITKTVHDVQNTPARLGDWVVYKINVNIPVSTVAYDAKILENIPDNQSLVGVYSDAALTSVVTQADASDTLDANDFRIVLADPLNSGNYTYYVKTVIDTIDSGNTEIQTNNAKFEWWDSSADPKAEHSVNQSVTLLVNKPELGIVLTADKNVMHQGDSANFTMTIDNKGLNTAYFFVPTVSVPDGFSIANLPAGANFDSGTHTITFATESALESDAGKLVYTFTATLDALKGSGSTHYFNGYTGDYYTLPDNSGVVAGEELDSLMATKPITVPRVAISKTIVSTSSGDLGNIRPGDTVTYKLKVTVPKGTISYQTKISDVLPSDFEFIGAADGAMPIVALPYDLGNVDASAAEQIREITVIAKAKTSVNYNEGTTNKKQELNRGTVTWNKADGSQSTSNNSDISINVKVPHIFIGAISTDATTLSDAKESIQVTIPVTNNGQSIAYDGVYKVLIPAKLDLVTGAAISLGGVYNPTTRLITWSNIDAGIGSTESFIFSIKLNGNNQTGAGLQNIPINFTVDQYQSRPDAELEFKLYGTDINKNTSVNVAPATIEKTIIEPSNPATLMRPGDTVKYDLTITIPEHTTAYQSVLKETIGSEQSIVKMTDDLGQLVTLTDGNLSLGDLPGGEQVYHVEAVINTDSGFNANTYDATNQAVFSWMDALTSGAAHNDSDNTTLSVGQPNMGMVSSVNRATLVLAADQGTHSIRIENNGGNTAYKLDIKTNVPSGLDISNISDGGTIEDHTTYSTITWNLNTLNNEAIKTITFDYEGASGNETNEEIKIDSFIESYSSSETASAKTYPSISDQVTVTIDSDHTLSKDTLNQAEIKVLEEAKFEHTIENIGAGDDSYIVSHDSDYAAILYDSDGTTILAKDKDGNGIFEEALNGFVLDDGFEIDKGGDKSFYIGFVASITQIKNHVESITVTARSNGTNNERTAQDSIKIIGRALDGITMPADPSDNGDWEANWNQQTKAAGQNIVLTALTSKDITRVIARIVAIDENGVAGGYVDGTDTTPIELTKLSDGRFKGDYTIDNALSNGDYFIEYTTYNEVYSNTIVQDQDLKDGPNDDNNEVTLDAPSLSISLTPTEKLVASGSGIEYTLVIKNELAGGTTAYNFVPTVTIPEGLTLKMEGLTGYDYDTTTGALTFLSIESDTKFDLDNQDNLTKMFTLVSEDDLSADEILNIIASTQAYNSSDDNAGNSFDEKTTAAEVKTATLEFTKKIVGIYNGSGVLIEMDNPLYDDTRSDQDTFVRPGDQIIYDLFIDVPEGLSVKDVKVTDEVYNTDIMDKVLDIEKILINGQTTLLENDDDFNWSKTFSTMTADTHVFVYARVKDDLATGEFIAKNQAKLQWESKYRDYTGKLESQIIEMPMKQPEVEISGFTSPDTLFNTPGETIVFSGDITNIGSSMAYDTKVIADLPEGFVLEPNTISGNGIYNVTDHAITWLVDELAHDVNGNTKDFSFKLKLAPNTDNRANGRVEFILDEYYSTNHNKAKKYNGEQEDIEVSVSGSQGLSGAYTKEVKAGGSVTFNHTLENTGGGKDYFEISVDNGVTDYPYEISIGSVVLAQDEDGDGVWDFINEAYASGGKLILPLEAGESADLIVNMDIPENTPKDDGKLITLTTKAAGIAQSQSAQNKIIVVGVSLDGWTGNPGFDNNDLPDSETDILEKVKDEWYQPTFVPYNSMKLEAITSVDIDQVKAVIKKMDGTIYGSPILLNPVNEATDVADGYTLWEKVDYRLPANIDAQRYFIAYEGYFETAVVDSDAIMTSDSDEKGIDNYFKVADKITIKGTITGKDFENTVELLPGSIIKLYDMAGLLIGETIADANGRYQFDDIKPVPYKIMIENDNYKNADKTFDTLAIVEDGIAVVDIQLIQFTLDLVANPMTIVGDGVSQSTLTTTVLDSQGQPLEGVEVTYSASKGTFPDGVVAFTNEEGIATVAYQSEKIEGLVSQVIPITARVDHYEGELHLSGEDQIFVTYEPAFIKGRVVDNSCVRDENGKPELDENWDKIINNNPLEGAIVEVFNDFDDDGINDFYSRYVTEADGNYRIAIPRGDAEYTIKITKPVVVDYKNNIVEQITFNQKVLAGTVTAANIDEFESVNTLVGLIYKKKADENCLVYSSDLEYKDSDDQQIVLKLRLKDLADNEIPGAVGTINAQGVFTFENINVSGEKYLVELMNPFENGEEIVIGKTYLFVSKNGDLSLGEILIDPYGTVTDGNSGNPIEGAQVKLYYGNNGLATDGTLVPLPEIAGFAPNDNINPQLSDILGKYAYMVYPDTKYYIIAIKSGYYTYDSREYPDTDGTADGHITVFSDIVKYDILMKPKSDQYNGAIGSSDLAVQVASQRVRYQENEIIDFMIKYKNKLSTAASNVYVQGKIPQNTTAVDLAGGELDGNIVTWQIGELGSNRTGEIKIKVRASSINSAELETTMAVTISSSDRLINKEDDESELDVLIFSNRFEDGKHMRYIKGYPDVTFRPSREITRAEIAAIFSRILGLQGIVDNNQIYPDVPVSHWASEYIEAAYKKGLFGGYADGNFKPDQAITRAELSVVIFRYLELKDVESIESHFNDIEAHWAEHAIEEIYRNKIINGYPDGTFLPNGKMVRVEAVTMVNRLLKRGPLKNVESSFVDVETSHWGLGEIEESSRTHEYNRNEEGSESMTKYIPEPLW